jgi:hypothetical protein
MSEKSFAMTLPRYTGRKADPMYVMRVALTLWQKPEGLCFAALHNRSA